LTSDVSADSPVRGTKEICGVPMVRIHLPPAASQSELRTAALGASPKPTSYLSRGPGPKRLPSPKTQSVGDGFVRGNWNLALSNAGAVASDFGLRDLRRD
jgi:hypothetical protein